MYFYVFNLELNWFLDVSNLVCVTSPRKYFLLKHLQDNQSQLLCGHTYSFGEINIMKKRILCFPFLQCFHVFFVFTIFYCTINFTTQNIGPLFISSWAFPRLLRYPIYVLKHNSLVVFDKKATLLRNI